MACGKITLAHSIHCSPSFFISFGETVSLYCEEGVYKNTHIPLHRDAHELQLLPNTTASETFLHKLEAAQC